MTPMAYGPISIRHVAATKRTERENTSVTKRTERENTSVTSVTHQTVQVCPSVKNTNCTTTQLKIQTAQPINFKYKLHMQYILKHKLHNQ
jgi:hypothetical protein